MARRKKIAPAKLIHKVQTSIAGDVHGAVLSGEFHGTVNMDAGARKDGGTSNAQERNEPAGTVVDIAILTILKEEYDAVCSEISDLQPWPGERKAANRYAWKIGTVACSSRAGTYRVAVGMTARAGTNQGTAAAVEAIGRWRPRYLFLVGIAGGFAETQRGDVVIADVIRGYEYGRIEDGRFEPRSTWTYRTDEALFTGSLAYSSKPAWRKLIEAKSPTACESRVHSGEILSGDKVVDDPSYEFFDEILTAYPRAIAVEMEGVGACCAIEQETSSGTVIGFLMVRGISDLPRRLRNGKDERGSRERELWKKYAADVAAAFTVGYIADGLPMPPQHPAGEKITEPRAHAPAVRGQTIENRISVRVLHQLPSPPGDFTGREEDLSELLAPSTCGATITGFRGMGGVGKTALALKLAEKLSESYCDAQFFVNLRGSHPDPMSRAEALAHVVRAYHPTVWLPESEVELRAMYCSVLHSKRALILLDDARDAQQVELLVPPTSCYLLITSRQKFALPGLRAHDLDALPAKDACDLLLAIAPRIGDRAGEIARLCGYIPLALRLVGSSLAEHETLSLDEYVERLKDTRRRLELVEASLSLSYELLRGPLQRQWSMLAVFPSDFDVEAGAAVWGLKVEEAREALDELVRCSLVEWNAVTRRMRLHDLVRLYADSRLGGGDRVAVQRRHAEHYEAVLSAADKLYLKGGQSVLQGLALVDAEWANIVVGQGWVASSTGERRGRGEGAKELARLCSDYGGAGAYVLNLRLHARERILWLQAALEAARTLGDRAAESAHLGNLGQSYIDMGEARSAIKLCEQQLVIAREMGNRQGESNALGGLGISYGDLGSPRRAIEYHEQSLAIAREIGDRRGEGHTLGNLGLAYVDLGDARRAIEFIEKSLAIFREEGDQIAENDRLGSLGYAYARIGDARRAIELFEQALVIFREIGGRREIGYLLGNLGSVYASQGEVHRAIEFYKQALTLFREMGDRRGIAEWSWDLGLEYEKQGDLRKALELMSVRIGYEREIEHLNAGEHAARIDAIRAKMARNESKLKEC